MKNKEIQVTELVNPARCEECGKSARWWVTIGDDNNYESHYYCDEDLPADTKQAKGAV